MALDQQTFLQNCSGQRKAKGPSGLWNREIYLVTRVPGDRQSHFRLLTGHKVLPERKEDNLGLSESTVFGIQHWQASGVGDSAWQGSGHTGTQKTASEKGGSASTLGGSQGTGEEKRQAQAPPSPMALLSVLFGMESMSSLPPRGFARNTVLSV